MNTPTKVHRINNGPVEIVVYYQTNKYFGLTENGFAKLATSDGRGSYNGQVCAVDVEGVSTRKVC